MLALRTTLFLAIVFFTFLLGSTTAQLTPMSFAQRSDVSNEIQTTPKQINQIQQLESGSQTTCQQQMQQMLSGAGATVASQFQSQGEQQQFMEFLENDILETVQLEMLEQQVLNSPQMDRFQQLWVQQRGVDALMSGRTSRQLNVSPIQINQIQQIQSSANNAVNECIANTNISQNLQVQIINNIQNIAIEQSINILDNAQVEQLVANLGEPFTFDASSSAPGPNQTGANSDTATSKQPQQVAGTESKTAASPGKNRRTRQSGRSASVEVASARGSRSQTAESESPDTRGGSR